MATLTVVLERIEAIEPSAMIAAATLRRRLSSWTVATLL